MANAVSWTLVVRESFEEPGWVKVSLRKQWWQAPKGTASRPVAETWFHRGTSSEAEVLEDALREILRAMQDRLG